MADDLKHLFHEYDLASLEVTDLEAKIEKAKERRSGFAKRIKDEFGQGPHDKDGKLVSVAYKGASFFLRAPFTKKKGE